MIKAVLLDLDGTLIQNDEREFVSAYLKLATEYFEENIGLSNMGDAILGSIAPMMTAQQHHSTNVEVAIDAIAKTLGQSAPDLEPLFVDFYAERFPVLQEYCASVDSANALIRLLLSMDLEVVIATNPVYPETAIFQRMEWAGIPGPEAFAYVTTGDNSHFIKPSPMYYAEIIARVGVEPEATLMVGNSLKNDIAPATALGIHTFHLNYAGDEPNIHPDQRGTLLDLIEHINTGWLDTLRPNPIHPAMIRAELQGNLGALYGLLSNVQEHQWDERPIPNEWTITEILCHLHNREVNVHRPRLKTILAQNNPFIGVPQPDTTEELDCAMEPMQIAHAFASEREHTLKLLQSLEANDWHRPANHSIFSQTNFAEMAHFVAKHDRMHITQICQTLKQCT